MNASKNTGNLTQTAMPERLYMPESPASAWLLRIHLQTEKGMGLQTL